MDDGVSVHSSDMPDTDGHPPPLFDDDTVLDDTDQILNDFIQENYGTKKVEDHMAPPVTDLLATTIDQWGLNVPNKNDIKLAFEQCKIPNNVRCLAPIRINDIIYQRLPFKAKELDRQAKNQSAYYTRAMRPLAFIWQCFVKAEAWAIKNKRDPPMLKMQGENITIRNLTACLSASMKLLCFHRALNLQKRKSLLRQHLDPKYFSLASANNVVTEFLFGDNLEQKVSDIFKVSQAARSNRFQAVRPRFRNSGGYHLQGRQNQFPHRSVRGSAQFKRSHFDGNRNSSFSGASHFKRTRNRFRQSFRGRQQF